MKSIVFLFAVLFTAQQAAAQLPEDAIRMSWNAPAGTARHQAIGGAMGSLGGEITSLFVNPAGLGFYKTNEFVFSPGFTLPRDKSNFRGTDTKTKGSTKFNFGTSGFVWSQAAPNSRWSSKTFSLAINRTANFNSRTIYQGENDLSSFSEAFAEEFSSSGLAIDVPLYTAPLSFGTKLANYTYLIDTVSVGGIIEVVGLPQRNAVLNGSTALLRQEKDIETKGGITEIAFGYASNMDDKLYIGGSLGIPIVNYERTSIMKETDQTADDDNNFNYATYTENYRSQGFGINARLGIIMKPVDQFRLGLAIHTPTLYGLKETIKGNIEADLENYLSDGRLSLANEDSIYTMNDAAVPEYRYDLFSPWKFIVSGSYMLNAVEDVTKQQGFITADVEYVTHGSSKFNSADPTEDDEYYQGVNDAVKLSYKGALNFRVGGELKFNTVMTRVGFAYYGSPYEDKALKAHQMNLSGGLGYRNKGIFVDVAFVKSFNRDVNFPYRLADKPNTFAETRNRNSNLILTFGVKF